MQHNAAHCSTLQHTAAHCSTLQHAAACCSTLQHTAARCSTLQQPVGFQKSRGTFQHHTATHCNILQHTASQSNTLQQPQQYTATTMRDFRGADVLLGITLQQTASHYSTHWHTLQHTATTWGFSEEQRYSRRDQPWFRRMLNFMSCLKHKLVMFYVSMSHGAYIRGTLGGTSPGFGGCSTLCSAHI